MSNASSSQLAQAAPGPEASLTELQNWFVQLLQHQKGLAKSPEMSAAAAVHFSGNDRVSPAEQVDIYRRQFWLRHTSILIDHFPGITGLLHQEQWEPIAESYLNQYGRDVESLSDLGRHMAAHLQALRNAPLRELLIDMARLEWAYQDAFIAADEEPVTQEQVRQIPPDKWPSARFLLADCVHLLELNYPVADLRRQLRQKQATVDVSKLAKSSLYVVVYRREGKLWDRHISAPAFALLKELSAGTPLIPACEKIVSEHESAAAALDAELSDWFSLWGRLGWIVGISTD